jgi:homoserine kinase
LIRGYEAVQRGAIAAGAYGMVISGAGPTLLALSHKEHATKVEAAMLLTWANEGISAQVQVLELDVAGATAE